MNMLWLGIALLTGCTILIIILPLLRNRSNADSAPLRADYDVALYKDQLKEIDRDLDRDLLSPEQADAARTEIQRKLLNAADTSKSNKSKRGQTSGSGLFGALAISSFIIIGAVSLYNYLGTPEMKNLSYASRDITAEERKQQKGQAADQDMQSLLSKLALRLEKNPADINGWLLLGRSLITRGRYDESAAAYKHALDLDPDNTDTATDYAEALIFTNQGKVSDTAYGLLKDALATSPADPKIRYYIGLRKAQNDDPIGALQDWTDIAAMSSPDAPWMPTVRQQIDEAFQNTGIDPASITPSAEALEIAKANGIVGGASNAPGPTAEDMQAAAQMSTEDQSSMIRSMVNRLAERLKSEPEDLEGWTRLARAYQVLGETEKAKDALTRIKALQNK